VNPGIVEGPLMDVCKVLAGKVDDVCIELGKIDPLYGIVPEYFTKRSTVPTTDEEHPGW